MKASMWISISTSIRALRRLSAGALLALAACAPDPGSQPCGTGGICPPGYQCAALEQVCIPTGNGCGKGVPEGNEECDDGNTKSGDGCSASCGDELCGNSRIDAGEQCDEGNATSGDGDQCSGKCLREECGNSITDFNEVCDDGNEVAGDGCSLMCQSKELCGNGKKDVVKGEVCDDGNTENGDRCSSDCKSVEECGNGVLNVGEQCDDDNEVDTDDCRNDCKLPTCGDGVATTGVIYREACDGTVGGSPGHPAETPACNLDCTTTSCGDGKINRTASEQCDDAASNAATGRCLPGSCQLATCGDTFVHFGVEACDNGGLDNVGGCDSNCTFTACGNGILTAGEVCDDGNTANGDGCSFECKVETCGNAIIDIGEACDPGSAGETAACNRDCTLRSCGDGVVNATAGERCDDLNLDDNDDCRNDCQLNICGDGHQDLQGPAMEACDDGNADNWDACSNACTLRSCGDGVTTPPEQCDLGATTPLHQGNSDSGTCTVTCLVSRCGDGLLKTLGPGALEECDDGAGNGSDRACLPTCKANVCGDGLRDVQNEACDDHNTTVETACPYGTPSCTTCNATCTQLLALTGTYCGDGVVSDDEVCDDGNAMTETACPYGTASCTYCDASCHTVLQLGGPVCGDGAVSDGEVCDDGNGDTETACPYGQSSCVACDAACAAELELSGDACGDGVVNEGEACDDGNATTELACPYGTASCLACDASCSAELTLIGGICGDGAMNGEETCDDGNIETEEGCLYGTASCTQCDASCETTLELTGAVCGDGVVNGGEACDDGNSLACGRCNATCTAAVGAASTGFLVITTSGAALLAAQGESPSTFTISDGEHAPVTFQLVEDAAAVEEGNHAIVYSIEDDATAIGTLVIAAINSVGDELSVSAASALFSSFVLLENERMGSRGNVDLEDTIDASGFSTLGMRGGSGADCGAAVGCTEDDVCASWQCALDSDDGGVCVGSAPEAGLREAASHPGARGGSRHIAAFAGDAALRTR